MAAPLRSFVDGNATGIVSADIFTWRDITSPHDVERTSTWIALHVSLQGGMLGHDRGQTLARAAFTVRYARARSKVFAAPVRIMVMDQIRRPLTIIISFDRP